MNTVLPRALEVVQRNEMPSKEVWTGVSHVLQDAQRYTESVATGSGLNAIERSRRSVTFGRKLPEETDRHPNPGLEAAESRRPELLRREARDRARNEMAAGDEIGPAEGRPSEGAVAEGLRSAGSAFGRTVLPRRLRERMELKEESRQSDLMSQRLNRDRLPDIQELSLIHI